MSTCTRISDLQRLTDRELHILYRAVAEKLASMREGMPERREAQATLTLIHRVIARRQLSRPRPG